MPSLRTLDGKTKFQQYTKSTRLSNSCVLCTKESIKDFNYWRLINNDFPYDQIAEVHHMLVPIRHSTEGELTKEEIVEYADIKSNLGTTEYDYIIEAIHKSVPAHFHPHLLVGKSTVI